MGQNFQDRAIQPEKLSKEEYQERVKKLRYRMVSIQNLIRKSKVPVLILFAGVDGAGKHETVDLLSEWMDPRWLRTRAYGEPTEEEKLRPKMWKYWRDLPGEGEIGLFLSASVLSCIKSSSAFSFGVIGLSPDLACRYLPP